MAPSARTLPHGETNRDERSIAEDHTRSGLGSGRTGGHALIMNPRVAIGRLISDPDFLALEDELRNQSVFHLLGVQDRERSHAEFLRWLLDPRGSHGMGSAPLRRFFLLAASSVAPGVMVDTVDIDGFDLDSVEVVTEVQIDGKRRLDIAVLDEQERPLMIIEYKVDAAEGEDQTKLYATWAAGKQLNLAGREVLPLLVFLCPDRDDDTAPAPPFIHMAYEPYCAWLAGLKPASERARQLVAEFRSCLAQREDVEAPELAQILERLQMTRAEEVAALTAATRAERAPLEGVLRRHDAVFQRIGIIVKRQFSLGESRFVEMVKNEIRSKLTPDLWLVTGDDSITARFKPALEVGEQVLGERALFKVALFINRPTESGNAPFRLSVRVAEAVPGLTEDETHELRSRAAASLRQALTATALGEHTAKNASVATVPIRVDMSEGDTAQASEYAAPAVWRAVEMFKAAEPVMLAWCNEVLPCLLTKNSRSQA
jgi:hypothetical protein